MRGEYILKLAEKYSGVVSTDGRGHRIFEMGQDELLQFAEIIALTERHGYAQFHDLYDAVRYLSNTYAERQGSIRFDELHAAVSSAADAVLASTYDGKGVDHEDDERVLRKDA